MTLDSILLVMANLLLLTGMLMLIGNRKRQASPELVNRLDLLERSIAHMEQSLREELRHNRQEISQNFVQLQTALLDTLGGISKAQLDQLKSLMDSNQQTLLNLNRTLEERLAGVSVKTEEAGKTGREELTRSLKEFQQVFDKNVESFNNVQREKFTSLENRQQELISQTEKKLEQMRETVDEKLQRTLNERLGQSFELVSRQLENVQKGLGEMQALAQDVGGLKKVLGNVKMRGGLGEVRLEMLLEQILAPGQYEANVHTKKGSADQVEFAIRLPGRDEDNSVVYLPIDAKFPQEVFHQLTDAYETGDADVVETAGRNLEVVIKKMARDIGEKYIDPPNTTEFGIMFLPFEGIYAEVTRRPELIELLQRDFRIIVTGPTTLAAILNSLQMGFKTLAIQKRSGEVWRVLGAVKTEFEKFGGLLEKAQKNLHTATNQLDELVGKRTHAIRRKLKDVESLPQGETALYLPAAPDDTDSAEENNE